MAITAFLQKKDGAQSTILTAISNSDLTIVLASGGGSKFPTTGNKFIISIDSEDILIDSRSTDTLTVNASGRGYNGTAASSHAAGATITVWVMSKHIQDLDSAVNTLEAASFPGVTAPTNGQVLTSNGSTQSWSTIAAANMDSSFYVPWTNWVPTFAGFSVDPDHLVARYMRIGKMIIASISSYGGTSNGTSFTISAPVTAATVTNMTWRVRCAYASNGGSSIDTATVNIDSNTSTFNCYPSNNSVAWSSSGLKRCDFTIIYESA